MDKRPDKKVASEKALKIVFSVVLVASALGLVLISDAGKALLSGGIFAPGARTVIRTGETPGVTPEATVPPLLLPEDFIAAVSESGPEGEYVRTQTDAYAADYTIRRDAQDFEAARRVLSLRDGKVTACMLGIDEIKVCNVIYDSAVNLLRNIKVETTIAGFHVENRDMQPLSHICRKTRIGVA